MINLTNNGNRRQFNLQSDYLPTVAVRHKNYLSTNTRWYSTEAISNVLRTLETNIEIKTSSSPSDGVRYLFTSPRRNMLNLLKTGNLYGNSHYLYHNDKTIVKVLLIKNDIRFIKAFSYLEMAAHITYNDKPFLNRIIKHLENRLNIKLEDGLLLLRDMEAYKKIPNKTKRVKEAWNKVEFPVKTIDATNIADLLFVGLKEPDFKSIKSKQIYNEARLKQMQDV